METTIRDLQLLNMKRKQGYGVLCSTIILTNILHSSFQGSEIIIGEAEERL